MGSEHYKIKVGDKVYHEEQKKEYEVYEVFSKQGIAYCKDDKGTYTFGIRWLKVIKRKDNFIDGTQDTIKTKQDLNDLLKDHKWKLSERKIRLGKNNFKMSFGWMTYEIVKYYYLENINNGSKIIFTNKKKMINHIFSLKEDVK